MKKFKYYAIAVPKYSTLVNIDRVIHKVRTNDKI